MLLFGIPGMVLELLTPAMDNAVVVGKENSDKVSEGWPTSDSLCKCRDARMFSGDGTVVQQQPVAQAATYKE